MKKFVLALIACSSFTHAAMAAESNIECSNEDGFQAKLAFNAGSVFGTLSYGQAGALTAVEGLETAFINGVGAAVKGNEIMLVVSPTLPQKRGELLVDGETYFLTCN